MRVKAAQTVTMEQTETIEMADPSASEIVKADDALVSVADLIFQAMRADERLQEQFETVDLPTLAFQLRTLLSSAFGGGEWPELRPSDAVSQERCQRESTATWSGSRASAAWRSCARQCRL